MYIDSSGHLNSGINIAINFDFVQWKIYTPKYYGNIEGG